MTNAESRLNRILALLGYDEESQPRYIRHNLLTHLRRFSDAVGNDELSIACEREIERSINHQEKAPDNKIRQGEHEYYPLEGVIFSRKRKYKVWP